MKILTLHVNYIKFKPVKKALQHVEDVEFKETEVKECLVVFTAVEKQDEANLDLITEKLVFNIKDIASQIKVNKIVLYPYAHLSSNLALPERALTVLKKAEAELKKDFEVVRAPFGYYKQFTVDVKGHPLSELSREITIAGKMELVSEAVKSEQKLVSKWFVLDLKGKLTEITIKDNKISGFDLSKHDKLNKFAQYEMSKVRAVQQEPPHVKFMKLLEIADYEPGSDPGNMRFYPKGRLIKSLLENYVTQKVIEYGGLEVETPVMYDYEHPALKKYLDRFPSRQYTVETPNKKAFLRFSACFGQFLIAHNSTISYKDLPLKLYELTRYSFRAEQRGELTGLRRLRAFTMPDCHALCENLEQAKKELVVRFKLSKEIHKNIGIDPSKDLELAIRITKDFYNNNKDYISNLVKLWGKPALVEMWDKQFFYFIMKYELNFVDALNKAAALTTDQIDIENAKNFDITFYNKEGKKEFPLILHWSPSGAIERVIYALLEKAYFMQQLKKKPSLPLWLSPIQIRLIPVSIKFNKLCKKLLEEFEKESIRVDLDDRDMTVGKKIMDSEKEWVPYVLVIGEKELKSKKFVVRIRDSDKQKSMTRQQLLKEIKSKNKEMPFKPLSLPKLLNNRPIFVG